MNFGRNTLEQMPIIDVDLDGVLEAKMEQEEEDENIVMHEGPVYLRTASDNFR